MKILLVCVALVILICFGCRTQYGENWQKVSLINSSIMMPGKAERTQEGTITRYMLNYNSEQYMVSNALMVTPPPEQINQAFDSLRNAEITESGGTLLSERPISIAGFPGRELTYEWPKYGKTTKERIYLAKSILYQISVSWNTGKSITGDGEKFLDSFEIQSR